MRQLSTRDQMTQKLKTIGHRTAFNNERCPYRIVSYKRPRNDNLKQFNEKTMGLIYVQTMNGKQLCNI